MTANSNGVMPNSLEFKWDLMIPRISTHLRQPLNSTG